MLPLVCVCRCVCERELAFLIILLGEPHLLDDICWPRPSGPLAAQFATYGHFPAHPSMSHPESMDRDGPEYMDRDGPRAGGCTKISNARTGSSAPKCPKYDPSYFRLSLDGFPLSFFKKQVKESLQNKESRINKK